MQDGSVQTFNPLSLACDLREWLQIKISSLCTLRRVVNLYHDNLRPEPDWMALLGAPFPSTACFPAGRWVNPSGLWELYSTWREGWGHCLLVHYWCSKELQNHQWKFWFHGNYIVGYWIIKIKLCRILSFPSTFLACILPPPSSCIFWYLWIRIKFNKPTFFLFHNR